MAFEYFKQKVTYNSFSDRLSSTWTFCLLIILALIAVLRQYIGPNAVCIKKDFDPLRNNTKYIDQECWMARSYWETVDHVYTEGTLYVENKVKPEKTIALYQWLPLILVLQAMLFRFPDLIIKSLDSTIGYGCSKLTTLVAGYPQLSSADKITMGKDLADHFDEFCGSRPVKGIPFGITTLILAIGKFLYFVNSVTQLTLMEIFLPPNGSESYGQFFAKGMIASQYSVNAFPRKILCSIEVITTFGRASIYKYDIQCSLPINDVYEQIYFLVWVWLVVVCVASATSGVLFLLKNILPMFRKRFVHRYLRMSKLNPTDSQVSDFANTIIGQDGVILFRLLSEISSDILVRDTIVNIWHVHHKQIPPIYGPGDNREVLTMVHHSGTELQNLSQRSGDQGNTIDRSTFHEQGQRTELETEMVPLVQA